MKSLNYTKKLIIMEIPFVNLKPTNLTIKEELNEAFNSVLDSGWYILGEKVDKFEKEYAEFSETKYAVGVSNGLDAIFLALKACGIKKGDEVIIPSNTYIATAIAISRLGATPVLVEPNIDTYNINPKLIEKAISKKTKAIIPVHLYGLACEMEEIKQIAVKNNLLIIEDNAQAHGSKYNGKITGSWGDINATSFYPGKNLGAIGDGGGITTDNIELANKIKSYRNYGSVEKYKNEKIGFNMRLDELQAAILSIKLKYIDSWTHQRIKLANIYKSELSHIKEIILPFENNHSIHVFHLFVIRTKKRNELKMFLEKNKIGTLIHYPIPIHLQEAYKFLGFKLGDYPIAENIANTCLSLPLYPGMTKEEVLYVVKQIKIFFKYNV